VTIQIDRLRGKVVLLAVVSIVAASVACDAQVAGTQQKQGDSVPINWSLDRIKTMPLDVEVISETRSEALGKEYLEREILYTSQIAAGKPVRALAYLTIPLGSNDPLPALVSIRALWGPSHKDNSVGYAQEYGVVSLGIHLPEGESRAVWPEGFNEATDDAKDYEKSYFYVLAAAAMRGITHLDTLVEVNPNRVGIVGFSRGGMAALIANGVDDRIRMAIAIATSGFSRGGLEHLRTVLPNPQLVASAVRFNPMDYAHTQHGALFMICGAQDPIFPYAETAATFQSVNCQKRLEFIFDWGHGNYVPDAAAEKELGENEEKKTGRVKQDTNAWIKHWLFDGERVPEAPTVKMVADGSRCNFTAHLDGEARAVLVYSTDGAKTFQKALIPGTDADRKISLDLSVDQQQTMTYYVEADYAGKCYLSSLPELAGSTKERS